jgi:hypothetical protein
MSLNLDLSISGTQELKKKYYPKIFEIAARFLNTRLLSPPGERIEVRGRSLLSPLILTFSPRREKEPLCMLEYNK